MLEKYKDEQSFLYNLLTNAIKNNKISHAYLFETNNNPISKLRFIGWNAKSISIVAQNTTTTLNIQNKIPKKEIK